MRVSRFFMPAIPIHKDPQEIMRKGIQYLGPNLRPRTTENGCKVTKVAERIETESAISSFLR